MKKNLLNLITVFAFAAICMNATAQKRYVDEVFNNVLKTANIEYDSNRAINIFPPNTPPIITTSLKCDIYQPEGDTAAKRPLIILASTGSYLPAIINQQPTGNKNDSSIVELANRLSKRGYVVMAVNYRLGWNPNAASAAATEQLIKATYRAIQDVRNAIRFMRVNANKFKIDTVVKTVDWRDTVATKTINEIVVESYSYTKLDYLEMTLAYSLYKLIQQGGWLKSTVTWLEQNRSLKLGNIIQLIQTEFLKDTKFHHQVVDAWSNDILPNHDTACRITVNGSSVFLENYYVVIAFLHHDEFTVSIAKLLQQQFQIPDKIIQDDLKLAVHEKNFGTKQGFFSKINYAKQFYNLSNPLEIITVMTTNFNDTGSILRAKKTYLV
jgi:hypothetical protein